MTRNEFPYFVNVSHQVGESEGRITFVRKGLQQPVNADGSFRVVPTYRVAIGGTLEEPTFDWSRSPLDPEEERNRLEAEATLRLQERANWISLVGKLIDEVSMWATELGWSIRRTDKTLNEERFGKHRVPVLIMQVDAVRLMLEPIGSSAPEDGGVAELYRMPAYDDIARIVSDGSNWWMNPTDGMTSNPYEDVDPEEVAFSKDTLKQLAAGMLQNA